ncbi:hypothetical protein PsorP6_011975 [Peronosclerospora sorghi]|uniref:Uncharacterized protein n=1 Tax=Peronosclerospora sorghi TaxID=230839 RepID=A0ACC0WLS6_9STRA|nr:hypothetical protein PsorP6_011975 [Peronosclerospora sorghi]
MSTTPKRTIFVSSRKSQLAMAQTNTVISMLASRYPDVAFVVGQEDTVGDQVLDRHLCDLGTSTASGLFTKSLEEALLAKTASFAVHSLKDMPTTLPDGLVLAAITKRESPEDAVVIHPKHKANGRATLKELPKGSVIGTSSLRREALVRNQFPSFQIKTLRGNIQTRLAKLEDANEYDAIIVAACGFRRGNLGDRIDEVLPMESFGYGVGQGSIGVECRADDHETIEMLKTIIDEESAQLCKAERSLLYHLEGGCQIAMGVSTTLENDTLTLHATVLSRDGKARVHERIAGPRMEAEELGKQLAARFWANEVARQVLGPHGTKRALTYGNVETPGDAAAAADPSAKKAKPASRVLQPFRALGVVVDHVPIVTYAMGATSFATASVGKSFVVYKCDKLTPVLVSPPGPQRIAAVAVHATTHVTFTACGRDILVWKRVTHVETLRGHPGTIQQLLTVGHVLLSLDTARCLVWWDVATHARIERLTFPTHFTPTTMLHPVTYVNKILVGSEHGALQLWNVRTKQCIYEFRGWASAVTTMAQSPAVDVVAIGLADGRVVVHHLQLDATIVTFAHDHARPITALSFRTDAGATTHPFLVAGARSGDVSVWNLHTKRLESVLPRAHDGAIVSLEFLANEPLLLSCGTDNAMKLWLFEQREGGPTARLLKSREGHAAPPTRIRYYGNQTLATMADGADGTCCQILSAGQDRAFRVFHTAREQQSRELSQGPVLKKARRLNLRVDALKLPPIVQFAAMETRARDWANVVTCHENELAAYVWRFEHRAIGKKVLRQFDPRDHVAAGSTEDRRRQRTQATSVAITCCGNYALVGTLGGAIFQYNMQSGEPRGSFPVAATPKPKLVRSLVLPGTEEAPVHDKDDEKLTADQAHVGLVTAVAVDALNETLVSAGIDGSLKFWGLKHHDLRDQVNVGAPISHMELHRESNLLCVACDDHVLRVFDVATHHLVRRFQGHAHRVTDVTFSGDARWIFSASADATVRVWDVPTGKCIDWVRFQKPVTGVAVSPTGEFLATTHVNHVGIFLWANRSFFSDVFLDTEPREPVDMDLPVPINEVDNCDELGRGTESNPQLVVSSVDEEQREPSSKQDTETEALEPLDASLITLSTAPRAFWQSLFHLEVIKQRNKPIEPPKAPVQAPFFLPTTRKDDVQPTFVPLPTKPVDKDDVQDDAMEGWGTEDNAVAWGGEEEAADHARPSRIVKTQGLVASRSKLATLLVAGKDPTDAFPHVAAYLQSLSASAVDVELSTLCLGPFDHDGQHVVTLFLAFLRHEMTRRRDFQLVQAYLNRFLKVHHDLLVAEPALLAQVDELGTLQQQQWQHLQRLLQHSLCLVQHFSNLQM